MKSVESGLRGRLVRMRPIAAVSALIAMAGCSGGVNEGTFGNLLAYNSPNAPAASAPAAVNQKVDCPTVDVTEGGASVRVYAGGQSNNNVRYQYSLGDVARDCSVENNQIVMKVGVEGKVLLGPAGAPSSFNVPVKISVRRESDEKILETKIYRVATSIPSGSAQGTFSVVSDQIRLPYLGENAYDDYQVFVGFEGSGGALPPSKRRRRQ